MAQGHRGSPEPAGGGVTEAPERQTAAEGARRHRGRLRAAVLAHYGQICACCDATEWLEIDHVGGGGNAHRLALFGSRKANVEFWRWLIIQDFPGGYQTLCRPCNRSKGEGAACRIDHVLPAGWRRCLGPCERALPLGEFHRGTNIRGGRRTRCRDCVNASQRAKRAAQRPSGPPPGMRRCTGPCGQTKVLAEFSRNGGGTQARQCRGCFNASQRARRAARRGNI